MARRWYLSDLIGTGSFTDRIRPVVHDLVRALSVAGVGCSSVVRGTRCLTVVEATAAQHLSLAGDARVDILPSLLLTESWGSLSNPVRNAALNRLTARGFSTTGIVTSLTFGQVLRLIGRQLEPDFNEELQRAG